MSRSNRRLPLALVACLALPFAADAQAQSPAPPSSYSGHGADSLSRETIQKYAPKPLAPDVSRRIQQALDLRSPGGGQLSPDGTHLYFGWSITGTPQIWRLDAPKAFPLQMTGGEDRTGLSGVAPDGSFLVVSRDRGGQEDPGLYLQPAGGGPLRLVQHEKGSRAFLAFVAEDSKSLVFSANDREPGSYAVYRYEIASGKKELLVGEPGLWSVEDRREEGGKLRLLLSKALGSRQQEVYEWADGKLEPLFGQGETVEYDVAYGPRPGEVLVRTDKLGEFRRLYRWTRAKGLEPLTPEKRAEVAGFGLDRVRQKLYVVWNDGGYFRTQAFDATTLAELSLPAFPGADSVTPGSSTPDGRFVILGVETGTAPRASYVWDWKTKSLVQWTVPSTPEVDTSTFAVDRLEHYPARDGTSIPIFVRYPTGCDPQSGAPKGPCPVIVDFHGGPEGQATPGFSPIDQLWIDAGFVYAQPNVRGSDGYGKSWLDADNGARRLAVLSDIEDAATYFRKGLAKDGKAPKLGVTGGSYGGYSTLAAMTIFAGAYDAGASIVGISNLETFLKNTAPYRRRLRTSEYGDPDKEPEVLRKLSPFNFIDRVKGPLLIIQGVDDPRVPVGEAIQMHEAMQAKGLPSELILLEGEGHGAARRSSQVVQFGHVLRFFEEHLLGKKAATP